MDSGYSSPLQMHLAQAFDSTSVQKVARPAKIHNPHEMEIHDFHASDDNLFVS